VQYWTTAERKGLKLSSQFWAHTSQPGAVAFIFERLEGVLEYRALTPFAFQRLSVAGAPI
jgi:hypothetical protein